MSARVSPEQPGQHQQGGIDGAGKDRVRVHLAEVEAAAVGLKTMAGNGKVDPPDGVAVLVGRGPRDPR